MSHLDDKLPDKKAVRPNKPSYENSCTTASSSAEDLVVQGSPGFVRVTSNSISVRQPLAKKMKRFVLGKHFAGAVTSSSSTTHMSPNSKGNDEK